VRHQVVQVRHQPEVEALVLHQLVQVPLVHRHLEEVAVVLQELVVEVGVESLFVQRYLKSA
jgi:hypothetical protein